jgi:hypothetical protein
MAVIYRRSVDANLRVEVPVCVNRDAHRPNGRRANRCFIQGRTGHRIVCLDCVFLDLIACINRHPCFLAGNCSRSFASLLAGNFLILASTRSGERAEQVLLHQAHESGIDILRRADTAPAAYLGVVVVSAAMAAV